MTALALADVGVIRGGRRVVADVDLAVGAGEWVGLIGPNGAGKTSLLSAVAGVLPSTGALTILGEAAERLSRAERARRVALVPQRPAVPAGMRVVDYVLLGRTPRLGTFGRESAADLEAVGEALSDLEAARFGERRLGELSGGELQKVVLARALAQEAPILLLDEPTSALDVGHGQQALDLIDRMRRERGLTVVSAIHDLTVAAQTCDRLVLFSGGRVAAEGSPRAVLTEARIREHYGAAVRVLDDGLGGIFVLPSRRSTPAAVLGGVR